MGIHRQGWLPQRKEEHATGCFRPYTGELPQPEPGLRQREFFQEADVKAPLLFLNPLQDELYPLCLDLS
jgi:hypothetical protein